MKTRDGNALESRLRELCVCCNSRKKRKNTKEFLADSQWVASEAGAKSSVVIAKWESPSGRDRSSFFCFLSFLSANLRLHHFTIKTREGDALESRLRELCCLL